MCGIAGQVCRPNEQTFENLAVYQDMQAEMKRRGPDQEGILFDKNAVLIHSRLSVMDPENGLQPMRLEFYGEEFDIVYNGEIYNADELRRELISLGHSFSTRCDTEVLLHSYAEWREKCLERLNGIFAFAVWEKKRRRLFLARDRMGVKPLFYAIRNGGIIFASEIKALLRHPLVLPEIDRDGLMQIMLLGPGRIPGSGVFRGIFELRPGEYGFFDSFEGSFERRRYWRLKDAPCTDTFEEAVEKVRFLILDSIKRQLSSDVGLCTFLSGGLDSSVISSVADREFNKRGETLRTVSVDYRDNEKYFRSGKFQPTSDPAYIGIMNGYLSAENKLVTIDTPELVKALYSAVDARDLPGMADVDSSLLLFCKEIKKVATVALSGECADEIFGGYPWYRDPEIRERNGFPWAQSTQYRAGFIRPELLAGSDPSEYVDSLYRKTLSESDILPGTDKLETRMKQMMNLNVDWFMQTLLDRKDRMSMYSGLEVRVPFCDHRIAEYLYTLPWAYKEHGGYEKGLLREAAKGLLPDEVLWRKKSPYPKTHNPSYMAAVSEELTDVLSDASQPVFMLADPKKLRELLTDETSTPWYGQLMTTPQTIAYFLQLNYWLKKYRVRLV